MFKTLQIVGDSKYGGATYLILEWCKYLLARKCQVDVLSTDRQTTEELAKISGVNVIERILIPREISPLADFKALCQVFALLHQEKYDVVHTYTATPGFLGRLAARLSRVPVIVHHQAGWTVTDYSSTIHRLVYTPLEYLATLLSTRGICVSHAVAEQARQLKIAPSHKLVTICNGIAAERIADAVANGSGRKLRQELGLSEATLILGSIGRLADQKDCGTLIRAVHYLRLLFPDKSLVLVLAGDGPLRPNLESLARSLGLDDQVRLVGFRKEIPEFLAGLDIFVSSSLWEGLSISVLEAMAAARPIVATSILPNKELIESEITGLLVPPKSPEQMANAIARLVREPTLARQYGKAAQQRVLSDYSIDRMFQQTWDLYLSLFTK